ncbi:hypothetical protein GCM10007269_23780 [Microbacterium murale]|uniref:Uncharacterized protein n=1 Tax=Microbacterium murale TaxID=1081040 RepID=A0ABQ1RW74_9MICO|nr:hypothetical protein GCM10007269_23780 [Microbacterium murale]
MGVAFGAEFFAEDAVVWTFFGKQGADGAFCREIGIRHVGSIGLRRDPQVGRIEAGEGLLVGDVCQPEGECEIAREIGGCGGVGHPFRIVGIGCPRMLARFRMTP